MKRMRTKLKSAITVVTLVLGILSIPSQATAAVTSIALEFGTGSYGTPGKVLLGSLASRSGSTGSVAKSLSKSTGSAPYTMTGTDSLSGQTYQYQTMQNYVAAATLKESIDVTSYQSNINPSVQENQSTSSPLSSKSGVYKLSSSVGSIGTSGGNNGASGAYGSVFGPEIWSVPFEGTIGKSVSFDWAAAGGADDYEIYAFLVKISSDTGGTCTSSTGIGSYGLSTPTSTHTLMAYGRGTTQDWITASGAIPSTGCYRFRFVSGSFDQTGGLALGAYLYVANTVVIGQTQTITFPQPADYIVNAADQTFAAGASTDATGATLTYSSSTTSICTVASDGTITRKANQTGTCTITVNSASYGDFARANPVTRSFAIRASAVAPVGQGTSFISGAAETCSNLTAVIGTWNDGGSAITGTTYQWKSSSTLGGTYADISGATSASYTTTSNDYNKYIKLTITRTNAVGDGSETTSALYISNEGTTCTSQNSTKALLPSSLVTFAQNGADNNSYPQSEVKGETKALWKNVLTRAGYTFAGWNTKADGSGTAYADGALFNFDSDYITLYAQWKLIQTKPTITWATPDPIEEGTALSATQLNALASVPGTYTYSPAIGSVPASGKQILKVTFTPTDAKYETIEATVNLEVLAKAKVTWANPSSIVEGTALSSTQLNATASVPGSFTYDPKDGASLTPGTYTLKVTFTPTDKRLSPVNGQVTLQVTARPLVTPEPPVSPTASITGVNTSQITWLAGTNAVNYSVKVQGKEVCLTSNLTCDFAGLFGPSTKATVTSISKDNKTSSDVAVKYQDPSSPIVLATVNFDSGKSLLKADQASKLKGLISAIKASGLTSFSVYGHTDSQAGIDNQKLSIDRAKAMINYLEKQLPNVKFNLSGYAASKPVADNSTAEGKAANRRAEIFIP